MTEGRLQWQGISPHLLTALALAPALSTVGV